MANSVGVRTAAGGILSLPTTPADVIGRCDQCRRTFREGDWYCDHLAARHGHPIAWLSDQPDRALIAPGAPGEAACQSLVLPCAPTFLGLDDGQAAQRNCTASSW